jgi:signal transduction histidine kinase/CheY-like chemotaxis protein
MKTQISTKWVAWLAVLTTTLVVGWLDWVTGAELDLFLFYFLPVSLAAWYMGLASSLITAVTCALVWFAADVLSGHTHSSHFYAVWNTTIQLCSFLAVGWSAHKIHALLTAERQKSEALQASEKGIREANEQLEEKIRERTAELVALNRDLMESRDQLRSLATELVVTEARERRALASELHDTVAQTLAAAKLALESIRAGLGGKAKEEVKRVVNLIQQANRETRSLMSELSLSLLHEDGLKAALCALARRMEELHSLAIEVMDDGSPKPLGEDCRIVLFRAVKELLHNVVKHAKASRVQVLLQRDERTVRIEVKDDGVGFLPSEVRCASVKGECFGLFSIQERMQHLGGSFEVFSEQGKGARAVLVVPLQVEEGGEGRESATVRLLIAEDHRMMRDALASLLKEWGFGVVGLAEDGLEAVRLARDVKPDVVLMDIQMPRMDRIEATRQIKAELPQTKVIGLSVRSEPQIASEMLAAGATSFVPKSSGPEELARAIWTAVGSGRRK